MNDLTAVRTVLVIHTVAALVMGYLSVLVAVMSRTLFAVGAGIVILIIVGFITEKIVGKRGFKFWLANGVIVYLLFWFVTWTYLINL